MTLAIGHDRTSRAHSRIQLAVVAGDRAFTPIAGRPILWHAVRQLTASRRRNVLLALDHRSAFENDLGVDVLSCDATSSPGERLLALMARCATRTALVSDGEHVSDVNLNAFLRFHRAHGRLASIVAVRPEARFGRLELAGARVVEFREKPDFEQGWTPGRLMLLEAGAREYLTPDDSWEQILGRLADAAQLMAFTHTSFWGTVTTLRDRERLEASWHSGRAPWKTWK